VRNYRQDRPGEIRAVRSVWCILCISVASSLSVPHRHCVARLLFTGPNPFFSSASFPQDGLLFKGAGSFVLFDRHPRGWFGNLDDPRELPSANYTMTSQHLRLTEPSSEFSLLGTWTQTEASMVPYYFEYRELHIQSLLSVELEDLYMNAEGVARSHEDTVGWSLIPFEAVLKRRNKRYGFGAAVAGHVGSVPAGIRLSIDRTNSGEPHGYLKKTVDGAEEVRHRYTWGWTTQQGCNHILASHANVDAWYQDRYSAANSWLINAVVGATMHDHKVAVRYRHFTQNADEYRYDSAQDAYVGDGEWMERTSTHLLRGYGLFKVLEVGHAEFCLVGFAETERNWINWVGEGDQARLDCTYDKKTDFEIVPVVSSSFGRGFVRGGSDLTWGWVSQSNTDIWGRQRVYRQSYPYAGWTPDWEEASYSNSFYIANLSEVDIEYPILRSPQIALRLEVWRMQQFTYSTSHYGENQSRNGGYVFEETAYRKDRRKETWVGGLVGFWVGFEQVFGGLFVDLPVTYHSILSTQVNDNEEGELFSDEQTNFPAVQDPPRVRVILGRKW